MKTLSFRPHHFMCTLGFEGKGYSSGFVENYQAIADQLRGQGGDSVVITVASHTDSVCGACPHKQGDLCGSDQPKIEKLDNAHGIVLNLQPGDQLTWGEAKKRIATHVDEETFNRMCEGCGWKSLGVCLKALIDLKNQNLYSH